MPLKTDRLSASYTAPSASFVAISPSDSVDLAIPARALYVGGGGNIAVIGLDDESTVTTFIAVPTGSVLPIRVKRVKSTGTTATNLIGLL